MSEEARHESIDDFVCETCGEDWPCMAALSRMAAFCEAAIALAALEEKG